jgi:hypothetical protein
MKRVVLMRIHVDKSALSNYRRITYDVWCVIFFLGRGIDCFLKRMLFSRADGEWISLTALSLPPGCTRSVILY